MFYIPSPVARQCVKCFSLITRRQTVFYVGAAIIAECYIRNRMIPIVIDVDVEN